MGSTTPPPLHYFLVDPKGVEPSTNCLQGSLAPTVHASPKKIYAIVKELKINLKPKKKGGDFGHRPCQV